MRGHRAGRDEARDDAEDGHEEEGEGQHDLDVLEREEAQARDGGALRGALPGRRIVAPPDEGPCQALRPRHRFLRPLHGGPHPLYAEPLGAHAQHVFGPLARQAQGPGGDGPEPVRHECLLLPGGRLLLAGRRLELARQGAEIPQRLARLRVRPCHGPRPPALEPQLHLELPRGRAAPGTDHARGVQRQEVPAPPPGERGDADPRDAQALPEPHGELPLPAAPPTAPLLVGALEDGQRHLAGRLRHLPRQPPRPLLQHVVRRGVLPGEGTPARAPSARLRPAPAEHRRRSEPVGPEAHERGDGQGGAVPSAVGVPAPDFAPPPTPGGQAEAPDAHAEAPGGQRAGLRGGGRVCGGRHGSEGAPVAGVGRLEPGGQLQLGRAARPGLGLKLGPGAPGRLQRRPAPAAPPPRPPSGVCEGPPQRHPTRLRGALRGLQRDRRHRLEAHARPPEHLVGPPELAPQRIVVQDLQLQRPPPGGVSGRRRGSSPPSAVLAGQRRGGEDGGHGERHGHVAAGRGRGLGGRRLALQGGPEPLAPGAALLAPAPLRVPARELDLDERRGDPPAAPRHGQAARLAQRDPQPRHGRLPPRPRTGGARGPERAARLGREAPGLPRAAPCPGLRQQQRAGRCARPAPRAAPEAQPHRAAA